MLRDLGSLKRNVQCYPTSLGGLHPVIITRLVKSGFLKLNQNGDINQHSVKRFEKFMETHYFLSQRVDYLAEQAGITSNTFTQKAFQQRSIDDFITNLGTEGRSSKFYAYSKTDEPEIINRLRKRRRGTKLGKSSYRAKRHIKDIDIEDPSAIKLIEVSEECFLGDELLREVMDGLDIPQRVITMEGLEIPVMDTEHYGRLREYLWELRQVRK